MNWLLNLLKRIGAKRPYFHIIGTDGSIYMRRWWIFGGSARDERPLAERGWKHTRLDARIGRVIAGRLHHIAREDRARDFHTHPASFISIVLAGWYRERRPISQDQDYAHDRRLYFDVVRYPLSIAYRHANDRHTITEVASGGAWTLVIWFRKTGTWGFATKRGFINWRNYEVQP